MSERYIFKIRNTDKLDEIRKKIIPIASDGTPKKQKMRELFEYLIIREHQRLDEYKEPLYLISGSKGTVDQKLRSSPGKTFNVN